MLDKIRTWWHRLLPYAIRILIALFLLLAFWRYNNGHAALAAFDVAVATFLRISDLAQRPIYVSIMAPVEEPPAQADDKYDPRSDHGYA